MYKNKESFALGADDLTLVRNEINRIYDMDVESIRNLGHISKSLLTGTNTFTASTTGTPGNLSIPADNTILQGLTFKNTPWAIASNNGDGGTWKNGHIYEDGGLSVVGPTTSSGRNIKLLDNVAIENRLTVGGTVFKSSTFDSVFNSSGLGNTVGYIVSDNDKDKKLMIVGNNLGGGETRRVGIRDELVVHGNMETTGNIQVNGNITINGNILRKRNYVRYIRVGNALAEIIGRQPYWTIKEFVAYDINGTNVALNKPVTQLKGGVHCGTVQKIVNGIGPMHEDDICGNGFLGNQEAIHEVEIDLGQEYYIEQIIIYNRWNGDVDWRLDGTTIELLNLSKQRKRLIHTGAWHRQYSKEYLL